MSCFFWKQLDTLAWSLVVVILTSPLGFLEAFDPIPQQVARLGPDGQLAVTPPAWFALLCPSGVPGPLWQLVACPGAWRTWADSCS